MKTLTLMLSRMIFIRFAFIVLGISLFVISLELATYADDILKLKNNDLGALSRYALLKLPGTVSTFMAISVLLALLLTLTELSYRSEMTAIWAAGASPMHIVLMLAPVGLLIGALNFLNNDQAVPRTATILHEWGIGDFNKKKLSLGKNDPIWMRAGNDILRAESANTKTTRLENVVIFRRDDKGNLLEQIMAQKAELSDKRWHLSNVVVYYRQNLVPNRLATLIYSGDMRPAAAGSRSGNPEEMSIADLDYFIANAGFGIRPAYVYKTWWHKRTTLLVSAWLMILICIPLVVKFRRGGGIGTMFAIGVTLGFSFFLADGISLTIGELGIVPAWMAAWGPVLIFAGVGTTMLLRAETLT